jgi:predicted nucleic acid-binding protein
MSVVFADTVYYVAAVNARDPYHATARAFGERFTGRFVTTEFVLLEVANFFIKGEARSAFLDLERELRNDADTEIVPATAGLFARGRDLFAARPDKEWSLTDCTSFVVLTERKITDALTADLHFVQAGFRALLLEEEC